MKHIIFHTGGPDFHPTEQQAREVTTWLGQGYHCEIYDGREAFDRLAGCDLLVLMGMHSPGDWAGNPQYHPLLDAQRAAFEDYIASGRPLLVHHAGIISYPDWPRFGELTGFTWVRGATNHGDIGDYPVRVLDTRHPVVAGVEDFTIFDELYYDVRVTPGLKTTVHAEAPWEGRMLPMVTTAEERPEGKGRTVYLANGHDMRAFASSALRRLWGNAVGWLLGKG